MISDAKINIFSKDNGFKHMLDYITIYSSGNNIIVCNLCRELQSQVICKSYKGSIDATRKIVSKIVVKTGSHMPNCGIAPGYDQHGELFAIDAGGNYVYKDTIELPYYEVYHGLHDYKWIYNYHMVGKTCCDASFDIIYSCK
jgi:hypothetical protein